MEQYIKNYLHQITKKSFSALKILSREMKGVLKQSLGIKKKKKMFHYVNVMRKEPLLFLKQFEKHAMNLQNLSEKNVQQCFFHPDFQF